MANLLRMQGYEVKTEWGIGRRVVDIYAVKGDEKLSVEIIGTHRPPYLEKFDGEQIRISVNSLEDYLNWLITKSSAESMSSRKCKGCGRIHPMPNIFYKPPVAKDIDLHILHESLERRGEQSFTLAQI